MMKKIIILILSVFVLAGMLSSCGQSMTDDQARIILTDLVPRSQLLHEVFLGDAMKTADPNATPLKSVTGAQYYPVSEDSPYHSIAEIKAAAEAVYTAEYARTMYAMAFEGTEDYPCRYMEEEDGTLTMDITYEPFDLDSEIDIGSARVVTTTDTMVVVEVNSTANGETKTRKITLVSQNGVWLLDSPTY